MTSPYADRKEDAEHLKGVLQLLVDLDVESAKNLMNRVSLMLDNYPAGSSWPQYIESVMPYLPPEKQDDKNEP
jgi:hypothetical protein